MIETLYKLTTGDGRSKNGDMEWSVGCVRTIPKAARRTVLCEAGLLHAYRSPELALLRDPEDAAYGPTARMWEVRGQAVADSPLKVGSHRLRVVREIPLPDWYTDEKVRLRVQVRFALLCWKALNREDKWGVEAACEGVLTALRGGNAAELKTAAAAAWAAWAAGTAAWAAARAAEAAAAWAAWAARAAAEAAAEAAWAAAWAARAPIDFCALATRAVELEVVS